MRSCHAVVGCSTRFDADSALGRLVDRVRSATSGAVVPVVVKYLVAIAKCRKP